MQGLALDGQEGPGRVMEDRVRTMTTFLGTLKDSEAIFVLLHQMFYMRYPGRGQGEEEDGVTISFYPSPQLHKVSGRGLELLALTGREEASHSLHKILMYTIPPSVLLTIASFQWTKMLDLVAGHVSCSTEEEGRALASLLEGYTTWKVERLSMSGQAGGQNWERLGRAAAKGKVRTVGTTADVVGFGIFGSYLLWKQDFLDN